MRATDKKLEQLLLKTIRKCIDERQHFINIDILRYYQELDYDIIIQQYSNDTDNEKLYCAYASEFGYYSCYGTGSTPIEALERFLEEKAHYIHMLFIENKPIPLPKSKKRTPF